MGQFISNMFEQLSVGLFEEKSSEESLEKSSEESLEKSSEEYSVAKDQPCTESAPPPSDLHDS
jgi:hypothetical protein